MTLIAVSSETGLVALADPATPLPSGTGQDALLRVLEPLSRSSQVFYLVTDDPIRCRVGVVTNDGAPADPDPEFEPAGGAFGLHLPGGQVAIYGWNRDGKPVEAGTLATGPGSHTLSVLTRRPFDGRRHTEAMKALLGGEWAYTRRVDRLGLVGCLPLLLLIATLVSQRWSWLWVVLPLLAVSWLPYLLLKHGRRYRAAARSGAEAEQARPHYIILVRPADRDTVAGGFLRV